MMNLQIKVFVLFLFLVPHPHPLLSYSDIIIEREILMQKYIHLVQIMETEKVAANQLRTQLEDQETEIERLKAEVCRSASTPVCPHTKHTHSQALMPLQEFSMRVCK